MPGMHTLVFMSGLRGEESQDLSILDKGELKGIVNHLSVVGMQYDPHHIRDRNIKTLLILISFEKRGPNYCGKLCLRCN